MNNGNTKLRDDIFRMENFLVEYLMSKIEDLDLDMNIIETKVIGQEKFKKSLESFYSSQIKYEIHYLEESLSIDPIKKEILYNNTKMGYNGIKLSNEYYIKLIMAIISRKKYFEMIDKKEKLEKILKLVNLCQ